MLVPNAQIAALLSERIERHHLSTDREIWPTPKVRDFAGWVQDQYEQQVFAAGSAPRVLEDLEERQIWRHVVASSSLAEGFTDPGGAARAAREAWRAMQDYGIALDALSAYPGAETQALLQWVGEFQARCRDLHALPRCELLAALSPPADRPVPIENPGWRPQVRRWLDAHAAPPLAPMNREVEAPAAAVRIYSSFDAEMADCAHWAQAGLAADQAFRAFILIPNAALERARVADAFDAALAPGRYELRDAREAPPYAIAGGTPLAGFEPVRLALAALEAAVGMVAFEAFSRLLRAPALQGGPDDAGAAAKLDRELRRAAWPEAPLTDWLALARKVAAKHGLAAPLALLRLQAMHAALPARGQSLLSQWARVLVTAWEAGPWANRADWSSVAFQAAQRMRELLHTLARAGTTFGPLGLGEMLGAVQTAARDTAFQPQTGVASIWISSQLFDPWLSFNGLWMSGAGAQEWPPPARPLALLPVHLQRRHGISVADPAAMAQDSADLLRRWRERAGTLRFSCCGESQDAARISPLLAELPADPVSPDRREPHWQWLRAQSPAMEAFTDESGPPLQPQESTGGVGALKAQSLCPFRGFAVTRLQTRELDLPQPGFNPLERGIILHAALESIWDQLRGSRALADLDDQGREQMVGRAARTAVADAARRRDPGAVWRRREIRRLEKLLPQWLQLEAERAEFQVEALEAPRQLNLAGIELDVRIDRIDRLADGRLLLLDYKTGAVGTDWTGERPGNPQLPIYALCMNQPVAAVAYAQVAAAASKFRGIADDARLLPKFGRPVLESDSMAGQLALWRERLGIIATELRAGLALVAPARRACSDCPLPGLCRIDPAARGGADAVDDDDPAGEA